VLSYLVENAVKRSHLQGLMFGIGRAAVSYRDELVLHKVESDDPGVAGFVEMAADSIADALFEFGEGFGLGEDGLTEGSALRFAGVEGTSRDKKVYPEWRRPERSKSRCKDLISFLLKGRNVWVSTTVIKLFPLKPSFLPNKVWTAWKWYSPSS
jgi:hypothetical protein